VIEDLHSAISSNLQVLGDASQYTADANETDPRYLSYGVRAPEMKRFVSGLKAEFSQLEGEQKVELAKLLIHSGYGEQKTVALALLEAVPNFFAPERFDLLDQLMRSLHGWSKIDAYTNVFTGKILNAHRDACIELIRLWNADDDLWMRRASVVVFTRKIAKSGKFKDDALGNCEALKNDSEHLVQTGVGWCLRDLMRWHNDEILPYVCDLRKQGEQ